MGAKSAGALKRMKYALGKFTSKALNLAGNLSLGVGALAGLQSLSAVDAMNHSGQYAAQKGLNWAGNATLGSIGAAPGLISGLVRGIAGGVMKGASWGIGQKIEERKDNKKLASYAFSGIGMGAKALGKFLAPTESRIVFKGIHFNKKEILKENEHQKVFITSKKHPITCKICYLDDAMWKCDLDDGFTETSLTVPGKGNMLFTFSVPIEPKLQRKLFTWIDINSKNIEKPFSISFPNKSPNRIEKTSSNEFKVIF